MSNRDGSFEIYVMNVDGTNQIRLTNNPAFDAFPAWSPDGAKIVFQSNRNGNDEIYVMNSDGTNPPVNISNHPQKDEQPSWHPGSKIIWASNRDSGGPNEIYSANPDGTNLVRITNHGANDECPAWSPGGTMIAFVSERDGGVDIYRMNADGSNVIRLTSAPGQDVSASWSPDGTKIAFYSERDGNGEIYVMNSDGTSQTRLTNNTATEGGPSWSPFLSPPLFMVPIDIKPGSSPNAINPNNKGLIPVAILTTKIFDAITVDPSSVKFGPGGAAETHGKSHIEDVDGDGDLDMLLHFNTQETGIKAGDTEACLTGKTVDGKNIKGCDSIVTIPRKAPSLSSSVLTFSLGQNFSNPFNPDTWIPYSLAKDVDITIRIYNVSGLLIRTLDLGHKAAGFYITKDKAAYWDGRNDYGEQVSSGIYFYTIQAGEYTATRKMLLLK